MEKCAICKSDKNPIHHHLSYKPEIIVIVCQRCHLIMHGWARISQEQKIIINEWVEQYGRLWEDGNEKYLKSEHWKNINRKWQKGYSKTDKVKNYRKDYLKEYLFKKLTPKEMLERIEKMEKILTKIK